MSMRACAVPVHLIRSIPIRITIPFENEHCTADRMQRYSLNYTCTCTIKTHMYYVYVYTAQGTHVSTHSPVPVSSTN